MKINDIMSSPAIYVEENTSLIEVANIMKEKNIGFLPIVKNGFITGVITDRDIVIRAVRDNDLTAPLKTIMTPNPVTVVSDTEIVTVAKIMANQKIRRIIITLDGKPIGVATSKDLLKAPYTLNYVLETYQVDNTSPYYKIFNNSNPHDSIKVDDYRL